MWATANRCWYLRPLSCASAEVTAWKQLWFLERSSDEHKPNRKKNLCWQRSMLLSAKFAKFEMGEGPDFSHLSRKFWKPWTFMTLWIWEELLWPSAYVPPRDFLQDTILITQIIKKKLNKHCGYHRNFSRTMSKFSSETEVSQLF